MNFHLNFTTIPLSRAFINEKKEQIIKFARIERQTTLISIKREEFSSSSNSSRFRGGVKNETFFQMAEGGCLELSLSQSARGFHTVFQLNLPRIVTI